MKQDPGGDGDVQGVDPAEEGDGKQHIAVLSHQRPDPLAFAAHDETHVPLEADRSGIAVRGGIGAVDPESIFLHEIQWPG